MAHFVYQRVICARQLVTAVHTSRANVRAEFEFAETPPFFSDEFRNLKFESLNLESRVVFQVIFVVLISGSVYHNLKV